MHNSKGAFSETVYIYGHALQAALAQGKNLKVLSLGLGLGYNELLTTALALRSGISQDKIFGESFESVPELSNQFLNWLSGGKAEPEFTAAYEKICALCANESGQPPDRIKSTLHSLKQTGQWKFKETLTKESEFGDRFTCFLFDAFSSKTSPDLWDESFLINFLNRAADDEAVLSTYAFTGNLKRALQKTGFEVVSRPGFGGKRESTFAIKSRTSK